jgi:23S rRNA pseudouridine1911/1915/1917 synthase
MKEADSLHNLPDGFEILYEDGPLLAVNKPPGVATQAPAQFDSLEKRVRSFLAKRGGVEWSYLGVPHRLDRPVSGVILFTTKRRAAFKLSRQFERRTTEKRYWALVSGTVVPSQGTWTDYLCKVYGHPRTEVVDASQPGAQQAILHYRTLENRNAVSLLEIRLETGRTHQIRIQSSSRGHAVLGDEMYGSQVLFGPETGDPRSRVIALHARSITFDHPTTNQRLTLESPPPWPTDFYFA